ncbi:helix-turn-helix domain-containing protein [Sulfurimonas sp.]|uniref:helix-turn-helix domain-containing protein n=1 Tax=Sulfurimonas sp. TaxID=2022749 RepID=UPI002603CB6D|nr:helix-turn-helix domain-containing protein [Sulfurimonas sp.]MCW8895029.1 helix-turn-helix domain-containing protein [Sulfurimonas sp.]
MTTNYDALIPKGVLFNLQEIQNMKLLKIDMAKKLIYKGKIEVVKVGSKIHVSRSELIRYLEENTFAVAS